MEEKKHPVRALREILEMTQSEFAERVERSLAAIQTVEGGRSPLSKKLAKAIENETYAAASWLLAGDPANPVDVHGKPYTLETYKTFRRRRLALLRVGGGMVVAAGAMVSAPVTAGVASGFALASLYRALSKELRRAKKLNEVEETIDKTVAFVDELARENDAKEKRQREIAELEERLKKLKSEN